MLSLERLNVQAGVAGIKLYIVHFIILIFNHGLNNCNEQYADNYCPKTNSSIRTEFPHLIISLVWVSIVERCCII